MLYKILIGATVPKVVLHTCVSSIYRYCVRLRYMYVAVQFTYTTVVLYLQYTRVTEMKLTCNEFNLPVVKQQDSGTVHERLLIQIILRTLSL